ncbi:MAG TPA: GHKL domain-containing protein [Mobilitalea sp.]|nr:GHKL domain-containing protein [Mobilitalea sp.]
MTIPDIPRLYTAVDEWAACLVYILIMRKRFTGIRLILLQAAAFILLCVLQDVNGKLPLAFWIPGMVAAMLLMYMNIFTCCNLSALDTGACCARAFVLAELAASLEWQVYIFFAERGLQAEWISLLFMLVFNVAIYSVVYILESRHILTGKNLGVTKREVYSSVLIALAAFSMSNISFVYTDTPFSTGMGTGILYIRTLVDFAGFVMLFAQQDKWQELHMKQELEAINHILKQQYEQYQLSRDNIELLNRKYHDLKHQINIIRTESDPKKKEAYLEEMETGIKMYEAQNKTGNSVLDTILTSKSLYCVQHDINFTCVADGTLLSFMDVMDICSIFGNVLDNAVECVEQLGDTDLRLIRAAVFAQNNFLMIRVENYSDTELTMDDGFPVSTKSDKKYHGYGIKSIGYAVEKYEGTMTIHSENHWFTLRILIPLPDTK